MMMIIIIITCNISDYGVRPALSPEFNSKTLFQNTSSSRVSLTFRRPQCNFIFVSHVKGQGKSEAVTMYATKT